MTAALDLLRALIASLAGLLLWRQGRKAGQAKTALAAAERIAAAQAKGRAAVAEARDDLAEGMTPEQIVRANDGRWQ